MKKIVVFLLFILISVNVATADDFMFVNNIKYVSSDRAEEIWNLEIELFEGSSLVVIKNNNDTYYTKLYSNTVAKNIYINPFFLDCEGLIVDGDIYLSGPVFRANGVVYIPVDFFYDTFYATSDYDVIVVGGDPEGVVAAISAARNGANTLLFSAEDGLGGLFTYGMLNTLDMNYDKDGEILTKGIFDEFYDKVGRTESFSVEQVKKIFEDMVLAEKNIEYRANYKFEDAILDGNTITGVIMRDKNGNLKAFYGKRVIDATQDGDVCAEAGVPYYMGMEDINISGSMAATLVFKIGGVDWDELRNDLGRYCDETGDYVCGINESTAWGFGKWCYGNYKSIYNNMKFRGPNMGLQDDGTVLINALQIFYVDVSNEYSIAQAKETGKIEAMNAFEYLKTKLKAFENAYFIDTADELYIRETRHIQGEYVLQASDLLEGVNFDDKIAMASYPLDIQSTNMENNGYVVLAPEQYSIPYRCIVPKNIDNLFIVGKSASYSSVAAGSARVVPVGMVEGESAGAIAMYTISRNIKPRDIIGNYHYMSEVTEILRNQGVYLPDYTPANPYNDMKGYDKIAQLIDYGIITGGYFNDFKFDQQATGISSMNIVRNFAIRRYGFSADELKVKLERYYTSQPITVITLLRMLYSLENNARMDATDNAVWNFAIDRDLFEDVDIMGKYDTITMKDMYVIVVNYFTNTIG